MSALAIITSSPPNTEGGHLVIARALVQAARDAGHEAHLVVTPDFGFGQQTRSYLATYRTDVRSVDGRPVDQVISLRYPSYAVRHPRHVCWLNHTMRDTYDQWPEFAASISGRNRVKESVRRVLTHAIDRHLLKQHVTRVVAQSQTVQRRLSDDFGIRADVVYPPPPQRAYRCLEYGDFIFAVSRLTPLKRLDLLIRSLADPVAARVRVVIAGEGEDQFRLESLAGSLNVVSRVTFLGRADEATLLDHFARCRAVCFPTREEDYGFVTVEAFASRKSVVTCSDSGGPAELVRDGFNGFVCNPTAPALSLALGRLSDDRALAESLGGNAADSAAAMQWNDALRRLLV